MVADPLTGFDIYDSYDCGSAQCPTSPSWLTIGGTSLSSPLLAAAYALGGGAHGVPYPAVTLYGHPSSVYDVTTGGNGICDGEGAAQCPDYSTNGAFDLGAGMLDCAYTPVGCAGRRHARLRRHLGLRRPERTRHPELHDALREGRPGLHDQPGADRSTVNVSTGFGTIGPSDPFPGGVVQKYTWNWGDGSPNTVTSGSTSSVTHTFTSTGAKTVTVTAQDAYGVTTAKTLQVTVS